MYLAYTHKHRSRACLFTARYIYTMSPVHICKSLLISGPDIQWTVIYKSVYVCISMHELRLCMRCRIYTPTHARFGPLAIGALLAFYLPVGGSPDAGTTSSPAGHHDVSQNGMSKMRYIRRGLIVIAIYPFYSLSATELERWEHIEALGMVSWYLCSCDVLFTESYHIVSMQR